MMAFKTRKRRDRDAKPSLYSNGASSPVGGRLDGLTPKVLPDGRTVIFIKPGHNIDKVASNYIRHLDRFCGSTVNVGGGAVRFDPVDFSSGTE